MASQVGRKRRSRSRTWLGIAGLVMGALLLTACGRDTSSETTPPNAEGKGDGDTILIGGLSALSGPAATAGQAQRYGVELAIDAANEAGGVDGKQLELKWADDKGDPEEATRVAQGYVDEGADFLIGGQSTSVVMAVSSIAEQAQTPYLAGTSPPALQREAFHENFFVPMLHSQAAIANSAAELVAERPEWKRIAFIGGDYAWPQMLLENFKVRLGERRDDWEMVAERFPEYGASDYSNDISAILASDPDVVLSGLWAGEVVTFAKQAEGFGYFDQTTHFGPFQATVEVAEGLGEAMPEGMLSYIPAPTWVMDNPQVDRLLELHEAAEGGVLNDWAAQAYNGAMVMLEGIEGAGSTDAQAWREAITDREIETIYGTSVLRGCDGTLVAPMTWGAVAELPDLGISSIAEDLRVFDPQEIDDLNPSCEEVQADQPK